MQSATSRRQVRRVLIITLLLNLAVAIGKIILGMLTGALAITADGFHSLTDGTGNIAGLIAVAYAGRPPDDDHPYGHQRIETLAALLIGGLLLLTAWEVTRGIIERLQDPVPPEITPLTFGVLIATLVINIGVNRYQVREGKRLRSTVLLADAQNTGADVFVTLSVIVSTAIVSLTGWLWVDIAAALVVVVLIAHAAWGIVRQTGDVLVDKAPYSPEELHALLVDVPSIQRIIRARSRGPQDAAQIDIDVQVAPQMTADHAESIREAISRRLTDSLDGIAEVEVHFAPNHDSEPDYRMVVRACADTLGLDTHEVTLSGDNGSRVLEMHVEVPPGLTLGEAHEQVSQFEHDVQLQLPDIDRVVTHIEPAVTRSEDVMDEALSEAADSLETQVRGLLRVHFPLVDWHELNVRPFEGGFALNLHAALPQQITVEAAHNIAEDAETLLRAKIPRLSRVTIHTEPFEQK